MSKKDLYEEVAEAIKAGEPFGPADEAPARPMISAARLRKLILGSEAKNGARQLWLRRVDIDGDLDLTAQTIELRLRLEHCKFNGGLHLRQTQAADITVFDCEITGVLDADQLDVVRNLGLQSSRLLSGASFMGAKVGGQMSLSNAMLSAPTGENGALAPALGADRIEVHGNFGCDGLQVEGETRLMGAKVGGQFSINEVSLKALPANGLTRPAFSADRMEVGGSMFCRGMTAIGEMRMLSASIGGQLTFNSAVLKATTDERGTVTTAFSGDGLDVRGDLFFRDALVEGETRLLGAKIGGQIAFHDAVLKIADDPNSHGWAALKGDRIEIRETLYFDDMVAEGEVRLLGAKIGGQVSLEKAKLKGSTNEHGEARPAFNGDRIEVRGSMICRELKTDGEARMLGAAIGGQLTLNEAIMHALQTESGVIESAFSCDGATIGGDLFFDDASAKGEVRLPGVKIGGQLSLRKADLNAMAGENARPNPAFNGSRIEVRENMHCDYMSARGELHLLGAEVGGQLGLVGTTLAAAPSTGGCIALTGAKVDELILAITEVNGVVDLTDTKVRSLWDASNGEFFGVLPARLLLQGFSYESLREPLSAEHRLKWIEKSQDKQHYPQVYAKLAEAYRSIGLRNDARKVGIANERRARRDGSPLDKLWSYLLWKTIRYGYENWRAVVGLLGVIAAGAILFSIAQDHFVATVEEPPDLSPIIYAADSAIPVLDLGQTSTWATTGWLEWVELGMAVLGYALVAAVIAGLAGIFNRDQV
jgi:hypothetical protein